MSLDPPQIREIDSKPVVLASVTASDQSQFGPGSCTYHAASSTGVLIAKRDFSGGGLVSTLHRTGVHP